MNYGRFARTKLVRADVVRAEGHAGPAAGRSAAAHQARRPALSGATRCARSRRPVACWRARSNELTPLPAREVGDPAAARLT